MIRTLPVQRQTFDMESGALIATDTAAFTIMPAPAGTCPECAAKHDPAQPHNAQSLQFQFSFYAANDQRWPTWIDAMAHCAPEVQEMWTEELTKRGVDVAGGKLAP